MILSTIRNKDAGMMAATKNEDNNPSNGYKKFQW
ncbi:hypothetical protein A2U01_0012896, partial [Trifolium medium]|nr:hypothetical protein [Trifolium medium]